MQSLRYEASATATGRQSLVERVCLPCLFCLPLCRVLPERLANQSNQFVSTWTLNILPPCFELRRMDLQSSLYNSRHLEL
jgi:hypothetical protein